MNNLKDRISIVDGNIVFFKGDAIVNAANQMLSFGGGVCGAIFEAAGLYELKKECDKLSPIKTGQAVVTSSCKLKDIKYIIHAVGPIYDYDNNPQELLKSAYLSSLKIAKDKRMTSIAFPSISTVIYGYPLPEACHIALSTIIEELKNNENLHVTIYAYNANTYKTYIDTLNELLLD